MTLAQAQAAANTFRECLLDNGVQRVSIELQPGVAGSGWYVGTFKRGMGHHIASRPSQGLTPGLGTVKNGRGGANPLTGPLANCYGGWDYTARIITLAWANHPGAGGPWAVPGWGTVPRDNGRPYCLGWEFEGGYEPYTDEMHHFMACCGAGTLDYLGTLPGNPGPAPLECWGEHKDPWAPGRKVDRIGYTAASGRVRIAAVRGTSAGRDGLPVGAAEDIAEIKQMLRGGMSAPYSNIHWLERNGRPYEVFRSDPQQGGDGRMVLAHPVGVWYVIPNLDYFHLYIAKGLCSPDYQELHPQHFDHFAWLMSLGAKGSGVDVAALAAELDKLADGDTLPSMPPVDVAMSDEQVEKLAALLDDDLAEAWKTALADHAAETAAKVVEMQNQQARDGDPATGPVS